MRKLNMLSKRLLCIIILGILMLSLTLISLFLLNSKSYAYASVKNYYDNSYRSNIENELVDNSVLVVLDRKISQVNKIHNSNFFKGVKIEKIIDLTQREENTKNKDDNFQQILQIYLKSSSKEEVMRAVANLEKIEGILSAEPNYAIQPTAVVPNDAYYSDQWNLNDTNGINVSEAWKVTKGTNKVRVGIIDSGIANHSDLNKNLVAGYDYYNRNSIANDDTHGHGTSVAGIIGAVGNNSIGVAGINWDITMVPLQVSYVASDGKTYFDSKSVVAAIEWATAQWGTSQQIDIINYSGGIFGNSPTIRSAVAKFPGLFIWSAGNDGKNVDSYSGIDDYDLDNLISVGAIDKNNERSVWNSYQSSNFGSHVNIFAPGGKGSTNSENIPTTYFSNNYRYFNGTSAAAPHVTGVAALLLSINPNLHAKQLKEIILDTADNIAISIPAGSGVQNVKKLNAYKAIDGLETTISFNDDDHINKYHYVNVKYGEAMPEVNFFAPKQEGYAFVGYFDSKGNKYYEMRVEDDRQTADINMIAHAYIEKVFPVPGVKWDHTKDTTLEARWELLECNYTYQNLCNGKGISTSTVHLKTGKNTIYPADIKNYNFSYFTRDSVRVDSNVFDVILYRDYSNVIRPYCLIAAVYEEVSNGDKKCVAEGTMITLADGSQKPVELLTGNEQLLVWNLNTGSFDCAPILFIDNDDTQFYEVINLYFSDGTSVKVISEHAFWDIDLNKYVTLSYDAEQYVGHWFNKQTTNTVGALEWTSIQLINVEIQEEYTSAWSPVTYGHLCYYVNGMLSMPGGIEGLYNIFEVDAELMKYDTAAYEADIATYGLFTYEEFCELYDIPELMFDACGGQYLKVAIGKGLLDYSTLSQLVERYGAFFEN